MSSIREAFERFLKLYPFCYGYWKKYADCEKKLAGEEDATRIFQRGVEAIPLSVDLWLHYINFTMQCVKGMDTALEKTRGCVCIQRTTVSVMSVMSGYGIVRTVILPRV